MILTKTKIESIDLDLAIDQKFKKRQLNELLVIVPTKRKARNLKKEFIARSESKSLSMINIETLGTLSEKLLAAERLFIPLSEAADSVFIKQSISEVKLQYFKYKNDEIPRGSLDKIKNVISEYKKHNISPEKLMGEAENLELNEKSKALDIADIYKNFNEKCKKLNAFEIGDIYSELNKLSSQRFMEIFREIFKDTDLIIINGFDEFTAHEIEIIDKLSQINSIDTFVYFDYYSFNPLMFSHLDKCYNALIKKGFKEINDTTKEVLPGFVSSIRENLFKPKKNEVSRKFSDKIHLLKTLDRNNEVTCIAKIIKEKIIKDNVEPGNICLVFNDITKYSSIVKNVFRNCEIPFNLTDRISLDRSLPVTAIISLLEVIDKNYFHTNLFKALNNGFIKFSGIDIYNLYKTASELKITIGRNNWTNSINDAVKNIETNEAFNEFEEITKLKNYNKAKKDFAKLVGILNPFSQKMKPTDFLTELKKLLQNTNFSEELLQSNGSSQESNIKAVTTFFQTIEEIFYLLEKDKPSESLYNLNYYLNQLKTASKSARFNVKEKHGYGVLVTSVNEIRGLKFDHLFLVGLVDAEFPAKYSPEIFFSGSFAKSENAHMVKERYHFYQTLCSWYKSLYLTLPKTDGKKDLTESSFIKDFQKLYDLSEINSPEVEYKISSREEFQQLIGKSLKGGKEKSYIDYIDETSADIEKIFHAIAVEEIRTGNNPSVFSGFLNREFSDGKFNFNEEFREKLDELTKKVYSVSQLETYAKCPFKYFTERTLKIEEVEEPDEEIDSLLMGNIIHRILFQFYSNIKGEDIVVKDCSDDVFQKVKKKLFDTAEKVFASYNFDAQINFIQRERIFGFTGKEEDSILYQFLEYERNKKDDFIPSFFEVSFGMKNSFESDENLSSEEPGSIGNVLIRGKVDRVDIYEDRVGIVDYKLGGSKPTLNDIKDGLSLQLPVYLKIIKDILIEKYDKQYLPVYMSIYSLVYNNKKFGKQLISLTRKKNADIEYLVNEIIELTWTHIKKYVDSISKGIFNLSQLEDRENKICRFCNFKSVCRVADTFAGQIS
ncbi:MAG: exodeoxyribonuclease V subunit gamma [Ignavibacteria bacterium]|jgi:ATP-dependent helicase/nuclease subunit B